MEEYFESSKLIISQMITDVYTDVSQLSLFRGNSALETKNQWKCRKIDFVGRKKGRKRRQRGLWINRVINLWGKLVFFLRLMDFSRFFSLVRNRFEPEKRLSWTEAKMLGRIFRRISSLFNSRGHCVQLTRLLLISRFKIFSDGNLKTFEKLFIDKGLVTNFLDCN